MLLPKLPMTASLSEDDDGSHYPGPLFTNVLSFCPKLTPQHSNESTSSKIRGVLTDRLNHSEKIIESHNESTRLSVFLLNARSTVEKMKLLRLMALSPNYDFLKITETWLSDDIPEEAFALPGHQPFRKAVHVRQGLAASCM